MNQCRKHIFTVLIIITLLFTQLISVSAQERNSVGAMEFEDITRHWTRAAITEVISKGLFVGTSETAFSPNEPMTRGMFVTVLGRLEKTDISTYKNSSFDDVSLSSWYGPYVEWAVASGITSGTGNRTFSPDKNITRQEMATILTNYCTFRPRNTATRAEVATIMDRFIKRDAEEKI